MALVNENYLKLQGSYLFAEIAHRVQKFKAENPEAEVISLGIGDVTLPLPQVSIEAMHKAVDEMANKKLSAVMALNKVMHSYVKKFVM